MTLLWAILAIMAMAGAMLVLLPLLKYRPHTEVSSDLVNSLVFRDRLQELEADLQNKRVTQEEFTQLKAELELTLLEDVAQGQHDKGARSSGGKMIVWPLLVLIPLLALGLYWKEGFTPDVQTWLGEAQARQTILQLMQAEDFEGLEKMQVQLPDVIRAMQTHVQQQPEDHHAWYVLGASYIQMRIPQQAELAFSRAMDLDRNNADYLLGYTQAAVMLNDGRLTGELRQSLEALIERQPDNPKVYMTLGMAAFQEGNFSDAIHIWQRYLQRPNKDERAAELLERSMAVAQKQLAMAESAAPAEEAAVSDAEHDASKPALTVSVTVTDEVLGSLASNDTLFVYAKAVDGPPMPLAVVRQTVGQWPATVQLSDANAMTPMAKISNFKDVIVQARISSSGNAIPQSGDWVGPSQVIQLQPGEQKVQVEINARMP